MLDQYPRTEGTKGSMMMIRGAS